VQVYDKSDSQWWLAKVQCLPLRSTALSSSQKQLRLGWVPASVLLSYTDSSTLARSHPDSARGARQVTSLQLQFCAVSARDGEIISEHLLHTHTNDTGSASKNVTKSAEHESKLACYTRRQHAAV
jgi:hypothetical protein